MSARLGLPRAAVGSARVVGAAVGGAGGGSVSRLRGVQGLCVPADLLATGDIFLGCGFPTFAFFGSGEVRVCGLDFHLLSRLQRRSIQ